jgi:hypothetical protein
MHITSLIRRGRRCVDGAEQPLLISKYEAATAEDYGWTRYWGGGAVPLPSPDLMLQFRNSHGTFIGRRADFHPEFNVWGLQWRLTGIARWQLEVAGRTEEFLRAGE